MARRPARDAPSDRAAREAPRGDRAAPALGVLRDLLRVGRRGPAVAADERVLEPDADVAAEPQALDRLDRSDFTIEQHSALWLDGDEAVAFNDLALVRVPGDGVVEAALAVGGQRMGRYRCDGLVISTSIGSTAYAYSAGGPVVSPALDAVVVAPLAPLAGISRPMVTAVEESIQFSLQAGSGCPAIEVDGTMHRRTEPGEALDVRLKTGCGQVVRLDSDRYQRRNQVKLSLLDLPFLPHELRELAPAGALPGAQPELER